MLGLAKYVQGDLSVAGGVTHLAGSKLWVKNSTPILVEADKLTGEFEISAWNRKIEGAQISMGGAGAELVASNLVTMSPTKKIWSSVSTLANQGETRLWSGHLTGIANRPFVAPELSISGLQEHKRT